MSDKDIGTTFPMPSGVCRLIKYTKLLNEHYAKVNEENKRFDNPQQHIWDKYHNPQSLIPFLFAHNPASEGFLYNRVIAANRSRKAIQDTQLRILTYLTLLIRQSSYKIGGLRIMIFIPYMLLRIIKSFIFFVYFCIMLIETNLKNVIWRKIRDEC